jgi:hypothetical protein
MRGIVPGPCASVTDWVPLAMAVWPSGPKSEPMSRKLPATEALMPTWMTRLPFTIESEKVPVSEARAGSEYIEFGPLLPFERRTSPRVVRLAPPRSPA